MSLEKPDVGSDISDVTDVGCRLPSPLRGEPDADICRDAGDTTDPHEPEEREPALSDPTPLSPAARAAARILERRRAVQTSPPTQPKEDSMPRGVYDRSKAKPRGRPRTTEPAHHDSREDGPAPVRRGRKPAAAAVAVSAGGKLDEVIAKLRAERDELEELITALERVRKGRG